MSAPDRNTQTQLADQAEALKIYLEALLDDKPMSLPVPMAPPVRRAVIDLPVAAREVVVEIPAPVVTETIVPVAPPTASPAPTATPSVAATDSAIPDWARAPFPCLLLKVDGLSLALPLVNLHRILPWTEPTPIPGYLPWLLGMLQTDSDGRNLKVVDTALLVMPERVGSSDRRARPEHVVMIDSGEWGLTCESVSSVITLDPAKIRWRTSRTKRPWLAGTVTEHLCALLDAEQLAAMLSAGTPGLTS